jgi:hypothetical protein
MKPKLKDLPRIVGTILVVCLFCFFGLKSCFLSVWMYPDTPEKYEIVGEDGRRLAMIFLPSKRTIIHYTNTANREAEAVLTRMRGSFGTHYFGPIWRVEGPGVTFGLRWVPNGGRPLIMETKYLQKFRVGAGESNFPKVGKTSHPEIVFGDGSLKWQGMWFTNVEPDQTEIHELVSLLKEEEIIEPEN